MPITHANVICEVSPFFITIVVDRIKTGCMAEP
jgi:hypothetical protein